MIRTPDFSVLCTKQRVCTVLRAPAACSVDCDVHVHTYFVLVHVDSVVRAWGAGCRASIGFGSAAVLRLLSVRVETALRIPAVPLLCQFCASAYARWSVYSVLYTLYTSGYVF